MLKVAHCFGGAPRAGGLVWSHRVWSEYSEFVVELMAAPWLHNEALIKGKMCFQITAEELTGNDDYIELSFSARKLDDKVKTAPGPGPPTYLLNVFLFILSNNLINVTFQFFCLFVWLIFFVNRILIKFYNKVRRAWAVFGLRLCLVYVFFMSDVTSVTCEFIV